MLTIPVVITRIDQMPAPAYIKFLDFSHSPGDAKVTGIKITAIIDVIISIETNN